MNFIDIAIVGIVAFIIIFVCSIILYAVKHYFKLREDTKALEISKSAQSKAYQLEKKLKKLEQSEAEAETIEQNIGIPEALANIQNMTLEQAGEYIGIDSKDLNNPLVRPLAEKFFESIKQKMKQQNNNEEDVGY